MGFFGAVINGFKGDKSAKLASRTYGIERIKLYIEAMARYQTKVPYDNSGYKVISKIQECWKEIMGVYTVAKNNYNQNKDFDSLVTVYEIYDYLLQFDGKEINYIDGTIKIKNPALEEVVENIRNKFALSGKKKLNEKNYEDAYEDFVKCQKLHMEIPQKDISTCLADINYKKGMNFFRNEKYTEAARALGVALKNGANCINELNKAKAEAYYLDAKDRDNTPKYVFEYYVLAHKFGKSCDAEILESGNKYAECLDQEAYDLPADGSDTCEKSSEIFFKIRDIYQTIQDNTKYDCSKKIASYFDWGVKFGAIPLGWTDDDTRKVEVDQGVDDYNYAVTAFNRGDYYSAKQSVSHATFLSPSERDDFIEACDSHLEE